MEIDSLVLEYFRGGSLPGNEMYKGKQKGICVNAVEDLKVCIMGGQTFEIMPHRFSERWPTFTVKGLKQLTPVK